MRDTERRERQRHRQREKQAPCSEPDVGIDPGTLGSCPGPKADAKPLSHKGAQMSFLIVRPRTQEALLPHHRTWTGAALQPRRPQRSRAWTAYPVGQLPLQGA